MPEAEIVTVVVWREHSYCGCDKYLITYVGYRPTEPTADRSFRNSEAAVAETARSKTARCLLFASCRL